MQEELSASSSALPESPWLCPAPPLGLLSPAFTELFRAAGHPEPWNEVDTYACASLLYFSHVNRRV